MNEWRPAEGEILSVSDLLSRARKALESGFADLWLEGEISGIKIPASGHAYFSLTDGGAQVRAVCFRATLRLLDFSPRDGVGVLARGRLTVYDPRGDLQFVVEHMAPVGEGLRRLQLELLRKRLAAEGLFDPARKRPLPAMPRAVAVVTSSTGAAVRDVLEVLRRRAPWVNVCVCHTRVQGEGAAAEILAALKLAAEREEVDTIILGRGGGAVEDLHAFNDERLVRYVAACPKPVISAVGHETDVTLADFAADVRAPTPSAAAELAVRDAGQWVALLGRCEASLAARMRQLESQLRRRLSRLDPSRCDPRRRIAMQRVGADRAAEALLDALTRRLEAASRRLESADAARVARSPAVAVASLGLRLTGLEKSLPAAMAAKFSREKTALERLDGALEHLSPLAVLERGYAVVRDRDGRAVRDAAALATGQAVDVRLWRGGFTGEVRAVRKE